MKRIWVAGVMVVLLAGVGWAEGRVSTQQEREDFVKAVKLLEEDPLYEKAAIVRAWAVKLVDEAEDIEVVVDAGVMGAVLEQETDDNTAIVFGQFVLECGVYAIEKGKKDKQDPVERNVRAVTGTVKMYRNLIKGRPERKVAGMDELVKAVDQKKVTEYVKKKLAEQAKAEGEKDGTKKGQ